MKRREYSLDLTVNRKRITKVVVDPHYEEKHSSSIDDEIILRLVQMLDGKFVEPDVEDPPFNYFSQDQIGLNGKFYKLIWLLEENESYIGVINAYRR